MVLVLIALLLGFYLLSSRGPSEGFSASLQPAGVGYRVSQGVAGSWADRPASMVGAVPTIIENPRVIYQGSPLPLAYEARASPPPKDSMFYFARHRCAPECCPSPYSCSHGCVCFDTNVQPSHEFEP